jgi:hypothetical protein
MTPANATRVGRVFGAAALAFFLAAPLAAQAGTFNIELGSFGARVCSTANCVGSQTFELSSAGPVKGSFDLDTVNGILDLEISVASLELNESVAGDGVNGIAAISLSDVTYAASDLSVLHFGNTVMISFGQSLSAEGTQTQFGTAGGEASGAIPATAAVNGQCLIDGLAATCDLTFVSPLDVGDPASAQFLRTSAHINALDPPASGGSPMPEPGGALLFGVGALVVAAALRRRLPTA